MLNNTALKNISRQEAAAELLARRNAKNHLSPFIRYVFSVVDPGTLYKHNWHIDLISEYLEAVTSGEIRRLILNIPPRSLKSICVSIAWTAWLMGRNPSEKILCASYASALSQDLSVDTRTVIESPWYQLLFTDTILSPAQNTKSKFETTKQGHRIATSVGGSITGEGGNVKILDDPMDPEGAASDAEREQSNRWVAQTWSGRTNDPATVKEVVVMQRLHTNDTTGFLLKKGGWEHVKIPQEAVKKTIIIFPRTKEQMVREKGNLLHADRVTPEANDAIKIDLGSYGYASQQQQEPVPVGGSRIKIDWFGRYDQVYDYDEIVQSWDTANKAKELSNPSVCLTWGKRSNVWHLLQSWKEKVAYPALKKAAKDQAELWQPTAILIEDKASGQQLLQELQEDTMLPVIAIEPITDKATRMETQLGFVEAGRLALPNANVLPCAWLIDYETNLMEFPNPSEWDEIDATSQFIKWVRVSEGSPTVVPFSSTGSSHWKG